MHDEGPSPEDLERFGGETGYCPDCGAEIWDQADVCPECGAVITAVSSRNPVAAEFRQKWIILVIVLALVAFFLIYVL